MEARTAGWGHAGTDEVGGANESVTDVGDAALVQVPAIEIARGAVLAGRYQVEDVIGKGGSGAVLRAFDRVAQELVAIKILRSDLARDPHWVERFSRELRLGRQIQHPNVCRIFDIGEADGHRFLTMELATRGTLRDAIEGPPRALAERLADVRALVSGLAAIHAAGIIHRDIKPENLLRMADGRLVLSDFGLATNPSDAPAMTIMVGTPSYMAPEVVMGAPATAQSDVWAAGVVIHETLFGIRPYRPNAGKRRPHISTTHAGRSQLETAIAHVCRECTAEDPDGRPPDAKAIEQRVDHATSHPIRFALTGRVHALPFWGVIVTLLSLASILMRHHFWSPVSASSPAQYSRSGITTGRAREWIDRSTVLADLDGRVHCLSVLPNGRKVGVVWGSPRRAEDIDLTSGHRTRSRLLPATYSFDCPQLSGSGQSLLFTRTVAGEAPQIVLSNADGSEGRPLISGTQPLWLPDGEEFAFNLDGSHVALFSLSMMNFSVLPKSDAEQRGHVLEKAINGRGDRIGVIYGNSELNRILVLYTLPGFEAAGRLGLAHSSSNIAFFNDTVMLSDDSGVPSLARVDWRSGSLVRAGSVAGARELSLTQAPDVPLLIARRQATDVWFFDREHPTGRQITSDGHSYNGVSSPSGDVLVQSRLEDGRFVIVKHSRAGQASRLTEGPKDCCASFSREGDVWLYADYERRMIRICDGATCKDLHHDSLMPGWPVMSPDDKRVGFVAMDGSPRLRVVDKVGEHERDLGPAAIECPPVWGDPRTIWSFSGAGAQREWVEIDVDTGRRTGRSKAAVSFDPDKLWCGWESDGPESLFFRPARPVVRETTQLLRLPASELRD